ncbi:MAG TPA: hypothetical protein VMY98_04050 [Anaerolineae bacterium]|nr:hypothetical protein [Anaerolineae bacterium]
MKVEIAGKEVVLRERFPVREWDHLRKLFGQIKDPDIPWEERVDILRAFIESWDFDGDPQDVESWGDLDLFTDLLPLEMAITEKVLMPRYRLSEDAKN